MQGKRDSLILNPQEMNLGCGAVSGVGLLGHIFEYYKGFFSSKILWLGVYSASERQALDLGLITSQPSKISEVNLPFTDPTSLSVKTYFPRKLGELYELLLHLSI